MRNRILKTTALALGLGMATGLAYAQTDAAQPQLQEKAGAAEKSAKKVQGQAGADAGATAQSGSATTEGGATAQGGADVKKDRAASGQAGGETDTTAQSGSGEQQDPAASSQSNTTAEGTMKKDGSDNAASGAGDAKTDSTAQGESGADTKTTTQGQAGSDATQDNAAGDPGVSSETTASVNVTAEQQTELKTVFTETRVEPVDDIDVNISIGTAVPQTIELHPLPPRVVTIVPAYDGYEYFVLADGRIVIVEPATFEIVYILTV